MSETREQFRERIGLTATKAKYGAPYPPETWGAALDAYEAVYAQALRDLELRFETRGVSSDAEVKADTHAMKVIHEFAREHGIDLYREGGAS